MVILFLWHEHICQSFSFHVFLTSCLLSLSLLFHLAVVSSFPLRSLTHGHPKSRVKRGYDPWGQISKVLEEVKTHSSFQQQWKQKSHISSTRRDKKECVPRHVEAKETSIFFHFSFSEKSHFFLRFLSLFHIFVKLLLNPGEFGCRSRENCRFRGEVRRTHNSRRILPWRSQVLEEFRSLKTMTQIGIQLLCPHNF